MMKEMDYIRPISIEEAVQILSDSGRRGKLLAGGTDLLVQKRVDPPDYDCFVDISRLSEIQQIRVSDRLFYLGAGVTHAVIAQDPLVLKHVSFLAQACLSVGSPQIRNAGTIGGNVANAAACADSLPVLVCLDAVAHMRSKRGERQMLVTELVKGPHETALETDEIITHFTFLLPPPDVKTHFIKIGRRNAQSISRLSIAAMGKKDKKGNVDFIRICPGAATPRTVRFTEVEAYLMGKQACEELYVDAGRRMAARMVEITGVRWSTEYKEVALKAITERVLREVLG